MSNFLDDAKRVIKEEAESLDLLSQNLPANFENAVNLIFSSEGRLVVSGIGKSGHIGRKISSTMSSLGQKSFFMHPSEAQHGDLGMLDFKDTLLLISYSGETIELLPVIEYAKRVGIKIISISKHSDSSLAKNSDIALILPNVEEAGPLRIAPTVSSAMTLALGDALAISLLSKRGFTKNQFKMLHPGGALGKSLSFVADIMRTEMPIIQSGCLMQEGILIMTQYTLGCLGIIDNKGALIGIITDGDLRRHMSFDLLEKSVNDVMTKTPITTNKDILTSELILIMENKKITSVFVINDSFQPIGIVHIHDILMRKIV
jgi:arabinose-5-phosphate isomerase